MPRKSIAMWLFFCAAMVFAMAVIGAITRLTESGLSITEWRPISGVLYPTNDAVWQQEFDKYRASPQYQNLTAGMELAEFKTIYFWEWFHRLWGRAIGLVYVAGLVWFWARGALDNALKPKLLGLLALGGLQGVMGWIMVKSGLVGDMVSVSHYKLAAHLGLAALLYTGLIAVALSVLKPAPAAPPASFTPIYKHGRITIIFLFITLVWGAFVAGLDAGLIYNEWPLMGGQFVPPDMWFLQPAWLNIFANHAAVQFIHRCLGYVMVIMIFAYGLRLLTLRPTLLLRRLAIACLVMVVVQVVLGIVALLTHVHMHVAATHQAGAFILLGLLVWTQHAINHQSIAAAPIKSD